ncbi:MAG: helix-turn-helix transcriptional regulator [Dehalococcoidia bacterium]|jgi:transcriptional regulator with XRE-family HTH domain|nr:helix-turn-helix transcriptional regulator [Dehalococcoidia bacterium]
MLAHSSSPARHCSEQRAAVGHRLREWRLRRELSQVEVARVAGITQASLSNYETGKRDMSLLTFLGVVNALDVSAGDLLDIPDVIVVRDSRLGRAVARLIEQPSLTDSLMRQDLADAAS